MSNRQLFRDVVINGFSASVITPRHLRWVLLRLYGARIGRASVGARCFFGDSNISIGQSAYINYGVFFNAVISFIIVAFAVFVLVRNFNKLKRKEVVAPAGPPADVVLLTEIRDLLRNKA